MENNFAKNDRARAAAKIFCEKCPVPVTFLGWEVGATVVTGGNLNSEDTLGQVLIDHGSENGRMSWDPMLLMLALLGDEKVAGYDTVQGWAKVDADTGANHFSIDPAGLHRYVIKRKPDEYYRDQINNRIH